MFCKVVRAHRAAAVAIIVSVSAAGTNVAYAGPDAATQARCAAYAQRAVQQYQLMMSHPQCVVTNDPLTWQPSYDNHYNGCVIFGASMSKFADSGRDNHLRACGGLDAAPNPAPANPGAAPADAAAANTSASPPPVETKTIAIGQSRDQVIAMFGVPSKIIQLGTKEIDFFPDMKVTFVNGKVSNVE